MKIEITEGDSKGRYVAIDDDGTEAGEMTFSKAGAALWIIDHTEVSEAYRGQDVGQALVRRAVADARASGWRILPLCPFARGQFQRHPDWSDVLQT